MLILLPPSETKVDGGGADTSLDLAALGHPSLSAQRRAALAATRSLSRNLAAMATALKLGPNQHFELLRNRAISRSPVMPALMRYTGVLYDALDAGTLGDDPMRFAADHVAIHSALFGLLRADDAIPAYRVSHDSRLPNLRLRSLWRDAISAELDRREGLILDLRSEAYVALGPAPERAYFLRVVAEAPDGRKRAMNHFNKKGKGEFVRSILQAGIDHPDAESLLAWAADNKLRLTHGSEGELDLTVNQMMGPVGAARQQPSK